MKHARPEYLEISLYENNGNSKLTIKDDGIGNPDQLIKSAGSGMHIMNYRADIIGASLDIQSDAKRGTRVTRVLSNDKTEES